MLKNIIIFSVLVVLLSLTFDFQATALTQDSQKILGSYHNFEQSGFAPATSQIYSPNDSPPDVNVVPTPKTNVIPPTISQSPHSPISQSSTPQSQTSLQGNEPMNQPWIIVFVVLLVFTAVAIAAVKKGRSVSYNRKVSTG